MSKCFINFETRCRFTEEALHDIKASSVNLHDIHDANA